MTDNVANPGGSGGAEAEPVPTAAEQVGDAAPQRTGEHARGDVDELIDHAAQIVESLFAEVKSSQDEMARHHTSSTSFEEQPETAERRTPQEIVGDILVTAHRAAESMIEKAQRDAAWIEAGARRDALPIAAEAQRMLEEARRVHRDSQATLEEARLQADALLAEARADRERLIAEWTADAEQRRARLEGDNMRLEAAIESLRSEWVGRAAEALARLDAMGVESGSPTENAAERGVRSAQAPNEAEQGELGAGEVVRDLHSRLPEGSRSPETGGGA